MTIKVSDSLSGTLKEFTPLTPGHVGIYQCGPTVQSSPHIGHLRSAVVYDVWRKWFEYRGFNVTLVRNVTDIDDKILVNAAENAVEGKIEDWRALAYRIELEFNRAYEALGIDAPTVEPRATGHMTQIVELIQLLLDHDHAYISPDGSGDVYFRVLNWPEYGKLTKQSLDQLEPATDAPLRNKESPYDFALWKGHKETEPETASWPAPWGKGRPGWHIECSAMSSYYLGKTFDIHGGGLDLRFPHHENEIAQSEAAGFGFAQYWLHNGLVTIDGQKMSKSLGNSVFAEELFARYSPLTLRYFLIQAHYRSLLDLSEKSLAEANTALSRVFATLERVEAIAPEIRAEKAEQSGKFIAEVPEEFAATMDDDLNTPQALAVLFDRVKELNILVERVQKDAQSGSHANEELHTSITANALTIWAMLQVLGLDQSRWQTQEEVTDGQAQRHKNALDVVLSALITQRETARAEKDFARADAIRDIFSSAGIELEDGVHGSVWRIR